MNYNYILDYVEKIEDLNRSNLKSGVLARKRARLYILVIYGDLLE